MSQQHAFYNSKNPDYDGDDALNINPEQTLSLFNMIMRISQVVKVF